jgi:hypothetical protein
MNYGEGPLEDRFWKHVYPDPMSGCYYQKKKQALH